jgi:hypothetical protein
MSLARRTLTVEIESWDGDDEIRIIIKKSPITPFLRVVGVDKANPVFEIEAKISEILSNYKIKKPVIDDKLA